MLLFLLAGCVTAYHSVEAGWLSGPGGDGSAAHGGIAAYHMVFVPDDDWYGIGGGMQFWGTDRTDGTFSGELSVTGDIWTDTLVEAPLGLHAQGSLLTPTEYSLPFPTGLSVRAGPYLGEDDVRVSLDLLGQATLHGVPMVQWGTTAGVRWRVGLLCPDGTGWRCF